MLDFLVACIQLDPYAIIKAGGYLGLAAIIFAASVGVRLFDRKDSRFFKKAYLRRTELFYEKYGARAVILARFVPIVRTLAPILAGIGGMPYRRFLSFNIVGGVAWGFGVTALGYSLGSGFPPSEGDVLPVSLL